MKRKFTNWIMIAISLIPLGYLAIIWSSLPEIVPVHFDSESKPDRMGKKSELAIVAGVVALVSLFVYFLFQNIHRIDPKRKGAQPSATFQRLGIGLVIFLSALNFLIVNAAKDNEGSLSLMFPLLGLFFAFLGNYMINIKPNYFAGIRLPWTLSSDENWRKTHQLGGKLWFAGGMLVAIATLFLPPSADFAFFISVMVVIILVPAIYSYRIFKKQP